MDSSRRDQRGKCLLRLRLVLLPLLAFVGLVTFDRTLQTALEDRGYAWRIARLRTRYFQLVPELEPTLLASPDEQLAVKGVVGGRWQEWRSVAGMVAVVTAALAGSTAGLLALLLTDRSLTAGLVAGTLVFVAAAFGLMRSQRVAWYAASGALLTVDEEPKTGE